MTDQNIDDLVKELIPPDITPDMYDTQCSEWAPEYVDFLNHFQNNQPLAGK